MNASIRTVLVTLVATVIVFPFSETQRSECLGQCSCTDLGSCGKGNGGDRCCCRAKTLFSWNCCAPDDDDDGEDTIVTDRPDFTEASSTVGLGWTQLELGYTYGYDNVGLTSVSTEIYPQLLLRKSLFADWFEIRIAWTQVDEVERTPQGRTSASGSLDLLLGIKWGLTEQCGVLPEMAVITQMAVPTGDFDFSADEVLPGVNWLYSWEVNDWLSIGGSTQGLRNQDAFGHFFIDFAQSLTVPVSLTERFGMYTEWFAFFPSSSIDPDVSPVHFLDGGFTYLLSNDVQLDILGGVGLNDAAQDYFVGTGIAFRF